MMNWIGVVDCNNFFVSCERLFRPDLRMRPTVVLSSNDGCIVARSKEIKELGIPMGVPFFQVKTELKTANAAVFSSNFPLYRDISARVMRVLRQELDQVEQYSVDEAFFSLSGEEDGVFETATQLKNAVETRVGVPVSIGLGRSKTIAKCAVEVGKKGSGIAVLHGAHWRELQQTLPVQEIWGIGGKTTQKMRGHGILTVADLLACDRARIDQLFGIGGLRLIDELSERSVFRLGEAHELQKSIMSSRSFKAATSELSVLLDAVRYHVAHAAEELREIGGVAQAISVSIRPSRHGDWVLRGGSQEAVLVASTSDTRVLLREATRLTTELFEPGVPYKKAGVLLGMIQPEGGASATLFAEYETQSDSATMQVIDALNKKFGSETILLGRKKGGQTWQPSREQLSPAYTTKWPEIRIIKA